MTPVSFADWLEFDRTRREVQWKLDDAFDKLLAQFSFTRLSGLKALMQLVTTLSEEETKLFLILQNDDNHNILYRILPLILVRKKFQPTGEISTLEKELALELVHALCLLHPKSRLYFAASQYVEALVGYLRTELQIAALHALQAALVDSRSNQESFERLGGMKIVANLLLNKSLPRNVRRNCAEFLYLFVSPDQDPDDHHHSHDDFTERQRNVAAYLGRENLEYLLNSIDLADVFSSCERFLEELDEEDDDI